MIVFNFLEVVLFVLHLLTIRSMIMEMSHLLIKIVLVILYNQFMAYSEEGSPWLRSSRAFNQFLL